MDFSKLNVKLGKLAAKHDLRTLAFHRYAASLPTPPAACDYSQKVPQWGMLGNDQYGDCGFAMAVHQELGWVDNESSPLPVPAAQSVVNEYLAYTGGQDIGVVLLDMLNFWRTKGINGRKIGAFATLASQNHTELTGSVYLFGSASLGVQLPVAWKGAKVWDCPGTPAGAYQPGSWGGHAIPVVAYNSIGPIVVTWGGLLQMTWRAYDIYCDEAYAILSTDWTDGSKPAPNGFNLSALNDDLALVGQMDTPPIIVPPNPPVPPVPAGPTLAQVLAPIQSRSLALSHALGGFFGGGSRQAALKQYLKDVSAAEAALFTKQSMKRDYQTLNVAPPMRIEHGDVHVYHHTDPNAATLPFPAKGAKKK